MDSILPYINEENDVLYIRGYRRVQERVVRNLLTKTDYPVEQIADVYSAPPFPYQ